MRHVDLPASAAIQFTVAAILLGALSLVTEHREPIAWTKQLVVSLLGSGGDRERGDTAAGVLVVDEAGDVAGGCSAVDCDAGCGCGKQPGFCVPNSLWKPGPGQESSLAATVWLSGGSGQESEETVTLQITNRTV